MIGERLSRQWFDRYAREPFWRSVPFFLLATLLTIDIAYAMWIAASFWRSLPGIGRFLLVFIVIASPLILFTTVQQQRYIRSAGVGGDEARRILALSFGIATWGYASMCIALRLLVIALRE